MRLKNDRLDDLAQIVRTCEKCKGEFLPMDNLASRLCPDCDDKLAPGDVVREVILEGGEALRLARGLEFLEEGRKIPTGEVWP